jgi:hypothetical protein
LKPLFTASLGHGLDSHEEPDAAALRGKTQEFRVPGDGDRSLAEPLFPQGYQPAEEFLGKSRRADDVVVPEDESVRLEGLDFTDELVDRPGAVTGAVDGGKGAEITMKRAAPGRLDDIGDDIVFSPEQAAFRKGKTGELRRG